MGDFVGACHVRFERAKEMLEEDPGLAKAAWDWGFGDWETAIGAASHTGRKDIIELLLTHGARPDVFTLATMDQVDAVRAFVENIRDARETEGPHSISLFRHAEAGKAARVLEYLESTGVDTGHDWFTTSPELVRPLIGAYAWSPSPADRFTVGWFERLSCLTLATGGSPARNLRPNSRDIAKEFRFQPAGSRGATVVFQGGTQQNEQLRVEYAGKVYKAQRCADD
ncbi:MAG: hypothetical protein KC996_09460, partial [Phycisphaerales bacterium]|nr:hypothetical protein [Phycisphaerales bacterium]